MLIKNGLVFDDQNGINGEALDILIEGDLIRKVGRNLSSKKEPVLDAKGNFVIPGLVDMHAHLREPGQEHKETILTGTRAAAKGGITTLLAMPNTSPPADNPAAIKDLNARIDKDALVEVLIASAMTRGRKGKEAVDFDKNRLAGCSAFSDDGSSVQDISLLMDICGKAKKENVLLIEHPEIELLSKGYPVNRGRLERLIGVKGQPSEAESLDILILGTIAGMTGAKVHFTHISTKVSLNAVKFLKKSYPGLFTCDCTPHHLALSEEDIHSTEDTSKKMNPPLRSEKDRRAMLKGLAKGWIDAVATDHAPHTDEEKAAGFEKAPFGSIGFETFLPVTFTTLVKNGDLTMLEWVRLVSASPARILGVERGMIAPGRRADLVLFDPNGKVPVTRDSIISKSKNSAFLGRSYYGAVQYTIHKGKTVFEARAKS